MKTRWGDEGGGRRERGCERKKQRKTERKEAKSMVHSVGLQGDPPGQ